MTKRKWLVWMLAGILIAALAACGPGEPPAEEAPAEETPVEEAPAEEPPVDETPAEETPAEPAPSGGGDAKTEQGMPEGYPTAAFPIIAGGVVTESTTYEDGDMDVLVSVDQDPVSTNNYYKMVMSMASDTEMGETEAGFYLKGKKTGWETEIVIEADPADPDRSIVRLMLEKKSE